jgi:hypothetical protein
VRPFLSLPVALIIRAFSAAAEDRPRWLGPERDGVAAGEGHSSPVVVDGGTCIQARQGDREALIALRRETGQTGWPPEAFRSE